MSDDRRAAYDLLEQVVALDVRVVSTEIRPDVGSYYVRIVLEDDPDIIGGCVFGLLFALGVLSFHDARPRGVSEIAGYAEDDEWTVADLLRALRFERGELVFHADYVRGRMMKTTVEVARDGKVTVTTVNRGEAATRWVARLQGKKMLTGVPTPAR